MININLLPEEYRKKARTPIKLLGAFAGAVSINATLMAYLGWMAFAVAGAVRSEHSTLQLEMDGLDPQVKYHRSLEAEAKAYKSREETLAAITRSRINWTRKVDELIDVINRGGDGARHLVWLDDLHVKQESQARNDGSWGTVRAAGHSGSNEFAQVANFLDDLTESPFLTDFHEPAPPEGTQSIIDEELIPSVVWAFPLSLTLKGPEERP